MHCNMRAKKKKSAKYAKGGKLYRSGGKVGDPKKKNDKSFTTLREAPSNRPSAAALKQATGHGPGGKKYLQNLPKMIKTAEERERRRPASGKQGTFKQRY